MASPIRSEIESVPFEQSDELRFTGKVYRCNDRVGEAHFSRSVFEASLVVGGKKSWHPGRKKLPLPRFPFNWP